MPVKGFLPFSRVAILTEAEKSCNPPLELMLVSSLVNGYGWHSQRKLLPKYKTAVKSSSLAALSTGLANNKALLSAAISKATTAAEGVSEENLLFVAQMSSTITFLAQGLAICSGRKIAVGVLHQCHL